MLGVAQPPLVSFKSLHLCSCVYFFLKVSCAPQLNGCQQLLQSWWFSPWSWFTLINNYRRKEGIAYPLLMSSKVFRVGGCCWKHPYCVCWVSSVKLHKVRLVTKGLVTEIAHVWIHTHRQRLSGLHSTVPEGTSILIMSPQVRMSTEGVTGFLSCAGFPCVV